MRIARHLKRQRRLGCRKPRKGRKSVAVGREPTDRDAVHVAPPDGATGARHAGSRPYLRPCQAALDSGTRPTLILRRSFGPVARKTGRRTGTGLQERAPRRRVNNAGCVNSHWLGATLLSVSFVFSCAHFQIKILSNASNGFHLALWLRQSWAKETAGRGTAQCRRCSRPRSGPRRHVRQDRGRRPIRIATARTAPSKIPRCRGRQCGRPNSCRRAR